jgi:hypothetical protein
MTTETPDPEHLALLEAIGRALGWDKPYEELLGERAEAFSLGTMHRPPSGESLRVLGGAVDAASGRVAWIEERSQEPENGYVPVDIDLVVAWGGEQRSKIPVPTYNPYFGCRVRHMRWYGEALVFIYREKHLTIAARMDPPHRALEMRVLGDGCAVDGDTVYFASDHPGLIEARVLPSLAPGLPIPVSSALRSVEIWQHSPGVLAAVERPMIGDDEELDAYRARLASIRANPRQIPLPALSDRVLVLTPEPLWARLRELLAETSPPQHGVEVLVGAAAIPFWRDGASRATRYEEVRGRIDSPPDYLPVYWYQHLVAQRRKKEAEAWLAWLGRVSALAPLDLEPWTRGATGLELVARTALAHLRLRAASLAEICRTGRLPEGTWCYFFSRPGPTDSWLRDEASPPGFREVLREVASHKPKALSDR